MSRLLLAEKATAPALVQPSAALMTAAVLAYCSVQPSSCPPQVHSPCCSWRECSKMPLWFSSCPHHYLKSIEGSTSLPYNPKSSSRSWSLLPLRLSTSSLFLSSYVLATYAQHKAIALATAHPMLKHCTSAPWPVPLELVNSRESRLPVAHHWRSLPSKLSGENATISGKENSSSIITIETEHCFAEQLAKLSVGPWGVKGR